MEGAGEAGSGVREGVAQRLSRSSVSELRALLIGGGGGGGGGSGVGAGGVSVGGVGRDVLAWWCWRCWCCYWLVLVLSVWVVVLPPSLICAPLFLPFLLFVSRGAKRSECCTTTDHNTEVLGARTGNRLI